MTRQDVLNIRTIGPRKLQAIEDFLHSKELSLRQ